MSIIDNIMELHWDGYAPSQIDRKLDLPKGTSHDRIVDQWRLGNMKKYTSNPKKVRDGRRSCL